MDEDPLCERARDLVSVARSAAIGLDWREKFSCIKSLEDDWWDFFVTLAAVHVGIIRLGAFDPARGDRLIEVIMRELRQWTPAPPANPFQGLTDCKRFHDRTYDGLLAAAPESERRFATADVLGSWMVWNMIDKAPETAEERQLTRALGVLVVNGFSDWWTTKKPTLI